MVAYLHTPLLPEGISSCPGIQILLHEAGGEAAGEWDPKSDYSNRWERSRGWNQKYWRCCLLSAVAKGAEKVSRLSAAFWLRTVR